MIFEKGAYLFDKVRGLWQNPRIQRKIFVGLVLLFIAGGLGILLKLSGLLPEFIAVLVPESPFQAIHLAFSLVLAVEVVELIFSVADSISRAVGKQLEIMALILLRDCFKDIGMLHGPLTLPDDYGVLVQVLSVAVGALLLFICLGMYVKLHQLQGYIKSQTDINKYVCVKKSIALLLFFVVLGLGGRDLYSILVQGKDTAFFLHFYSTLIFCDVLLVLVSQYFMPSFHATFRNSGYAVGTLLMRIALGAPHHVGAALCVFAALYLLCLTWATTRFPPPAITLPKGQTELERARTLSETSERR